MENDIERLLLEMKVSELKYLKGYDQGKIGQILGCSRATISRLLKSAIEDGILEIRIRNPLGKVTELEEILKKKYCLKKVVVARGIYKDPLILRKAIGLAAAELASNIIQKNNIVGISCGRTIYEMISSLPQFRKELNIEVVPLSGGLGMNQTELQNNILSEKVAEYLGGKSKVLDVPVIVNNKETYNLLLKEKGVQEIIASWEKLDIVFIGIGPPVASSPALTTKYFISEEMKRNIKLKAVGDVCARFFDKKGEECEKHPKYNLMSINFKNLKKVPLRVGMAGGKNKIAAIKAALNKGLINILVTEEKTAKEILREEE